jgi:hypothetical protein
MVEWQLPLTEERSDEVDDACWIPSIDRDTARGRIDMTALRYAATSSIPKREWNRQEVQVGLLFASIVLTAIASLVVSLLFPPAGEGGLFSYPTVERDTTFFWALLPLTSINLVLAVVASAIAAVLLVPTRGWRWVTGGFAVALVGASLYAVGVGGWAMVYFFAADSNALDPATAAAFIESVNGDAVHSFAPVAAGGLLVTAGVFLLSVGLWRSGNVPKWVVTLGVAGSIITFLLPTDGVVGALVETPQAVSSILIGWYAWRRLRSDGQRRSEGMRGASGIARIAELGLVGSMILSACVAPTSAVQQQPDDHSFDQAERTRSVAGHAAKPDTSYEQVEHSRGLALSEQAAKPDTSYDQVERARGGAFGR